jgi:diguanylate cyclase (GGDEF)-like protein
MNPLEATTTFEMSESFCPENLFDREEKNRSALIVIFGAHIGKCYPIGNGDHIIGRSPSADIQIDQDSISRQHAKLRFDGEQLTVQDLGSTNGTFINGDRVSSGKLGEGDRLHIGETVFKPIIANGLESTFHREAYRLMTMDKMTGTYNRQFLLDTVNREVGRADRHHQFRSVALCDIDNFKFINDAFGHKAGNQILIELVDVIRQWIGDTDILCRYDGDAFAIVLAGNSRNQTRYLCEQIRMAVDNHYFHYGDMEIPVTISIGFKHYDPGEGSMTGEQLLSEADFSLIKAKSIGKNQVCG